MAVLLHSALLFPMTAVNPLLQGEHITTTSRLTWFPEDNPPCFGPPRGGVYDTEPYVRACYQCHMALIGREALD